MDQKLVEQKQKPKPNTQNYKIMQIWKKLPKSDFEKENDKDKKVVLKGELYTKVSEIYHKQEGKLVKRSTIRRCINSIIKAK